MDDVGAALLESAWITAKIAAGLGLATWAVGVAASLPAALARRTGAADGAGVARVARVGALAHAGALVVGGALAALTRGEAGRALPVPAQAGIAALAAIAGPVGGLLGAWSAHALAHGEGLRTHGPYGIVRHPLYASLIACAGAVGLALGSLSGTAVLVGALVATSAWRARAEDAALARTYGAAYAAYAARVRAFLPRV